MKAALVAVLVGLALAGCLLVWILPGRSSPPPPAPAPAPASPDLARRVAALEARVDELSAALRDARQEAEAARSEARREAEALRAEAEAARERAEASAAEAARPPAEKRPESVDAFAKEVSEAMRQNIRREFRRIADLITAPSPEALDQRRRQLKFFAQAFGNQAGLDQAQVATLERILNETDERAREDLRPLLQGVEDYRQVDFRKVRQVSDGAFAAQNDQFDREFPKDKAERLKQQIAPVRNLYGAMLDELERQTEK